ncbi:PaaX family transcriptional regulator C-terminal domain-containing protein [Gorillibacterium timonense]|uniref:PaaX family transcriptional regulator C-terminal domain-containing protein n=1 Tax=Gorillibacterium timonense TaxID=1689269 RepID=UPI00071DADBA|nr:PaaX family transcriptional regulator C-terminal domain-containing protein [Gorillibacterium timonense]
MLSIEKQLLYLVASGDGAGPGAAVKRLVSVYEARGVSHQIVRNSLASLKKEGYVASSERSRYVVTPLGEDFIGMINRKPRLYEQEWNGLWCMVLFEVPEADRRKRDRLRSDLLQLGFGALYKSVYVSPWDCRDEVVRLSELYEITDCVTVMESRFLHNCISVDKARDLWQLDAIQDLYVSGESWYRTEFAPALELVKGGEAGDDGLGLFVRFLELGEKIADFSLRDPMLPDALLPQDWRGKQVLLEFDRCLLQIARSIPESSPYRPFVNRFLSFMWNE